MKRLVMACAVAALAGGCSPSDGGAAQNAETKTEAPAPEAFAGDAPSGDYTLDKAHASLIFRVDHIGFSNYTAQFMDFLRSAGARRIFREGRVQAHPLRRFRRRAAAGLDDGRER